jgi:ribonucleoside-diphosphate reductase subunit M2
MSASIIVPSSTPASKAANGIADMKLTTPVKQVDLAQKLAIAPEEPAQEEAIEEYRTRFVGDVDLDEKDEPLLKESQRRFVLFPIQYHEVSILKDFFWVAIRH